MTRLPRIRKLLDIDMAPSLPRSGRGGERTLPRERTVLMLSKLRLIVLLCTVTFAAGAGAGCSTVGKPITGVANFAVIEQDGLYRGGQPSYEGIQQLKSNGVRTVIDLRDD